MLSDIKNFVGNKLKKICRFRKNLILKIEFNQTLIKKKYTVQRFWRIFFSIIISYKYGHIKFSKRIAKY